jgi:hypothetical protein
LNDPISSFHSIAHISPCLSVPVRDFSWSERIEFYPECLLGAMTRCRKAAFGVKLC